jgi:hypothetical protein
MGTSKTKNNGPDSGLPPALAAAVAEAEVVLGRYDRLSAALTETGRSIPGALAEERELSSKLGAAEIAGDGADVLRAQLTTVTEDRVSAARRRQSACEGLLQMDGELVKAREAMSRARSEFAASMVAEFHARWNQACRELAVLQAEAQELAAALRTQVTCPPPYTVSRSAATERVELRLMASAESVAVSLPPALVTVGGTLDRMDSAAGMIAGLKQAVDLTEKHRALARIRIGLPGELLGTYEVVKPFNYLGTEFRQGALINRDVLTDGCLYRFWLGRNLRSLDGPARATVTAA